MASDETTGTPRERPDSADRPCRIKDWPEDEKPREKLLRRGEHMLSDTELLAILIGTGTAGRTALDLARRVKQVFPTFRDMGHTSAGQWRLIKGLGTAKICRIRAAIEIARRFGEESLRERPRVTQSADVAALYMLRMRDLKREIFRVIYLNSRNVVIHEQEMEEGTVNQANPVVREILREGLEHLAVSLICVHNHPSGDPAPSREDREFTRALATAGKAVGIRVLDHIIIGDNRYHSFADAGDL